MREKQAGEMKTAWIPFHFLKKEFTVARFESDTLTDNTLTSKS